MSTHNHGFIHKLFHWIEGLIHTASEFLWDIVVPPRGDEHRRNWLLFWLSIALALTIAFFAYLKSDGLPFDGLILGIGAFIYRWYPIWLPLLLGKIFIEQWMKYIRSDFIRKNPSTVLEILIPKEITKSPKAMELFFTGIFEKGSVEYSETYWLGKIRPWFSFELASFGGEIHFFVWVPVKYRNMLESQLYAQYPTVEIVEVDDYTKKKVYHPPHNFMWGTYFKLIKPDAYPIMTYVDYGLDKETEEEYKIDPLSSLLEYIGSIKAGEEVWIQILTMAHADLGIKEGRLVKHREWIEKGKQEVNKIMKRNAETKSSRSVTAAGFPVIPTLTEWEKLQVEAIERSLNKRAFEVAIRLCYFAEKERFNLISATVSGLLGTFRKPFNSNLLNGFKLGWYTDLSDPMKDFLFLFGLRDWGIRKFQPHYAHEMLDAYRRRSFFYPPYRNWEGKPFILTAEELATIYHIPGQVVTTPTFGRIPSKKVEPPANLPI